MSFILRATNRSTITLLILATLMAGMFLATTSLPAGAQEICSVPGASESGLCTPAPANPVNSTLETVINLLLTLVGVISVITIIIGGIQYMTSAGDASKTNKARSTIIYSVVAIVVAIMARSIVLFVLDRV